MEELEGWVAAQLASHFGIESPGLTLRPLSGDASFRRYSRVSIRQGSGGIASYIAVDAPPSKEKNREFVAIADRLRQQAVLVPHVVARDFERGFMLLTDLGDQILQPLLSSDNVDSYYDEALQLLATMQDIKPGGGFELLPYSRPLLLQEMALFPEWFVQQLLGVKPSPADLQMLEGCFDFLIDSALAQPQVFVHRDYHSRNLMMVDNGAGGVVKTGTKMATIDFQDAVWGPVSYDLVSLLRDCYVVWPADRVSCWALKYAEGLRASGDLDNCSDEQFERWFDLMGLQRHLKVLGIFSRLALRDSKVSYLQDLPTVIHYVMSVAVKYTEMRAFVDWFTTSLQPLINEQPWSSVKLNVKE